MFGVVMLSICSYLVPFQISLSENFTKESIDGENVLKGDEVTSYEDLIEINEDIPNKVIEKKEKDVDDEIPTTLRGDDLVADVEIPSRGGPKPSHTIMPRPTIGTVSVLALPVYFPDQSNSQTQAQVDAKWDGGAPSARDYYLECSYNQLDITVDTKAWIQTPYSISYYAIGPYDWTRESELATWAINQWDSTVDFNNYDYIYIVYAGSDDKDDTHFWPHVWTCYIEAGDNIAYDKLGFVGEVTSLGTYAHEFGHSLGLIDYYADDPPDYYVGYWELMGSGNYNGGGTSPAHLSAYSKIELGWIKDSEILEFDESDNNVGYIKLFHLEAPNCPDGQYYAVKVQYDSTKFYLIEFRDNYGYDSQLPDYGVLWSLIDETKGSMEGRLYYMGGDHSTVNLNGVEFDDDETGAEKTVSWLTGSFELVVSAVQEYANYMEVFIDCFHDFGTQWSEYLNLPAGNSLNWDLTSRQVGQLLVFFFDLTSPSDFFIQKSNGGSWDNVFSKLNIVQDAVIYRVTSADDYRVRIENDNIINSIDVYYQGVWTFDDPYNILTNYQGPSTVYKRSGHDTNFSVSIDVQNINSAWDESATVSITFPGSKLSLAPGETISKTWYTPFKYLVSTFTWNLTTQNTGTFDIQFSIDAQYSDNTYNRSLTISIDDTAPNVNFNEFSPIYVSSSTYNLRWIGSDGASGLNKFLLYRNSNLFSTLGPSTFSDIVNFGTQGDYNFTIFAYDTVGNWNSDEIHAIYDYTDPSLGEILSDTEDLWGEYELSFEVSDNLAGVDKVEIKINYLYVGEADVEDDIASITFNIEDYASIYDSSLTITIIMYDRAGNEETEDIIIYLDPPAYTETEEFQVVVLPLIIVGVIGAVSAVLIAIYVKKKREGAFYRVDKSEENPKMDYPVIAPLPDETFESHEFESENDFSFPEENKEDLGNSEFLDKKGRDSKKNKRV